MATHTVLIGYGDTGRVATDVLFVDHEPAELVVVDTDPNRLDLAVERGATAVLGNGTELATLRTAEVQDAHQVIVAVADDAFAVRITAAVRSVNSTARVITLVREPGWRDVAEYLGADQVIVAEEMVGRLLGLSVRPGGNGSHSRSLPAGGLELTVAERDVRESEIGRTPLACGPLVLAVVRGGMRVWREDPAVTSLQRDDQLLVLRASTSDD